MFFNPAGFARAADDLGQSGKIDRNWKGVLDDILQLREFAKKQKLGTLQGLIELAFYEAFLHAHGNESEIKPQPKAPRPRRDAQMDIDEDIFEKAVNVFKSPQKARGWLNHPRPALGGKSPAEILRQKSGRKQIEEILAQIEHGIFA